MNLKKLISPENKSFLWDIGYSYDYMSGCPDPSTLPFSSAAGHVNSGPISLDRLLETNPRIEINSIPLHPIEAGLPWHTSINGLRQNKHWKPAVAMTNQLLGLFIADDTAKIALGQRKKSYADIAKAEIGILNDNWSRFSPYFWPAADQGRLELLAASLVFVFIFDDIWEMNDDETIQKIQVEFISCLKVAHAGALLDVTPLQGFINDIMQGFHNEDLKEGDGGKEVIARLVDFCSHRPPTKEFTTLREFLDYRFHDAASPYIFACVKFSLRSNVVIASPRIAQLLSLISDQICYANDLGSFDKEKEAYVNGDILYLINAVDIVRKVFNLPDDISAKSATLALQVKIEKQIVAEFSKLRASTDVTHEELEFVETLVYVMVGNVFSSVVMCRYGKETTRLSM